VKKLPNATATSGALMTKAELVASNPHLRPTDAEVIVATIFDQITAALARGQETVRGRATRPFGDMRASALTTLTRVGVWLARADVAQVSSS
jgi:hypothetical protein